MDVFTLVGFMACRVLILLTFIFHLSFRAENKVGWILGYTTIFGLYLASVLAYIIYNINMTTHFYKAIRKITIWNEMFSVGFLFLYIIYIFYYLKSMKESVKEKSIKVFV
jgi:hypothetical protein